MRSVVWTGHLHFGLVVLPVSLFAAARAETTRFKRIHRRKKVAGSSFGAVDLPWSTEDDFENAHIPSLNVHHGFGGDERGPGVDASRPPVDDSMLAETGSAPIAYEYAPVRQVLQSETTGEEVRSEDLVKGYQYGTNEFAVIEPAVIERAAVETSDTIDLFHFVKAEDVDPVYFERSYFVIPKAGGEKAYALLLEAMREEGYWGVGRIGMHKREHMLILRAAGEHMLAHTMFYVNEIRPVPEFTIDRAAVVEKELTIARTLIKAYAGDFQPEQFKDIYQERIKGIINAEVSRAEETNAPAVVPSERLVPDLLESIRLTLAQTAQRTQESHTVKKPALKSKARAKGNAKKKDVA
jgi:DNA end-binding protein Ku